MKKTFGTITVLVDATDAEWLETINDPKHSKYKTRLKKLKEDKDKRKLKELVPF